MNKTIDKGNKKLLFINYHYPPEQTVGSIRPAKFSKYLKRLGWHPHILTISEKHIEKRDDSTLKEVFGLPIYRTKVLFTPVHLAVLIKKKFLGLLTLLGRGSNEKCFPPDTVQQGNVNPCQQENKLIKTLKKFLEAVFEFPDFESGWFIPAVWRGYRIIKSENISIIVVSSPPRTVALVGLCLSYLLDIKLISDWRDPLFLPLISSENDIILSDRFKIWLEKKLVERSCKIITTTENYTKFLRNTYPVVNPSKFVTILNGYDREDIEKYDHLVPDKQFTLSYLGTFYYGRTPRYFLAGLSQLVNEGVIPAEDLNICFTGDVQYVDVPYIEGESVYNMVKSYGLSDCVKIREPVPQQEALSLMRRSHVLLLFAPNQYYAIPGKAFEYLGMRRKILCFSNEGATGDLIRETGAGVVVEPENVTQIKHEINTFYQDYKRGLLLENDSDISVFERSNLAGALSELLESMSS